MKVDYDIRSNEYFGVQPEFEEGKLSASTMPCIKTCVRKTYIVGGQRNVFDETIYTDAQSGKIYDISNGGEIKSFKIKAAEAYRNKDYTTAYQCYEKSADRQKRYGCTLQARTHDLLQKGMYPLTQGGTPQRQSLHDPCKHLKSLQRAAFLELYGSLTLFGFLFMPCLMLHFLFFKTTSPRKQCIACGGL